jgi:hypothetical protein
LEKAIEILSSDAVAGNSIKHLPAMLQTKGSSFSQLRSSSTHWNRVATYLQEQALKLDSRVLAMIAEKAAADPFIKVKKMLGDLLVRLMEEANEEAQHKGWCDTELSTNELTRKQKTAAVETLHAEIDRLQASIAKLTEDISVATKADAELDSAMAKQTKLRFEEKAKNTETIKDAGEAQTATERAISVLREFYVEAGEAIALVQTNSGPEIPEVFDSSYKGMGAESGGVLGMLEVIETDFARLETATKAAEASAQKEYDDFMTDSHIDGEAKYTEIKHKSAKKLDNMKALQEKKGDLDGTQKELEASLVYFDKLKPSCVDAGVVYEDRVARRNEEIESLREALRILGGEDIA